MDDSVCTCSIPHPKLGSPAHRHTSETDLSVCFQYHNERLKLK